MRKFVCLLLVLFAQKFSARAASWSTYTWIETSAIDGVTYTNVVALWSGHCYARGIFFDLPSSGEQTAGHYTDPRWQNFLKQNQLAFFGVNCTQIHVVVDPIITHALTNAAILSGHPELTNAPRFGFGVSAGGSSLRIAETNQAPWVSLNYGSAPPAPAPHYIGGYTNILQSPAVCLAVAVDNAGYTNNTVQYVSLNRPSNFLAAAAIKQNGLHAQGTNVYHIPALANMIFAIQNRIPTNQCVLNYQPTWNVYNETNGWLLDPFNYSAGGIWSITNWNAAGINGHPPTNCFWAQNEAVATVLRAWGSWFVPITITQPTGGDDVSPQVFAPGVSVNVRINTKGLAGAWTNLVVKDCVFDPPTVVGSATDGVTTNFTYASPAGGPHILVAEIAQGGTTRAALPIMFSVDFTNTVCQPCMDGWKYASPTGAAGNAGTRASPYDLSAITNANGKVKPGGALILMEGTYGNSTNALTLNLAGNKASPTYVVGDDVPYGATNRAHPRILTSGIYQTGSNIVVGNLLITQTNVNRAFAADPGYIGLTIQSPNSTNFDIHVVNVLGDGFDFYKNASNSAMYDCAAYNNWFYDTVQHRPRGHNFYVQGNGAKILYGCVSANSGDIGWHIYGQSAPINNIDLEYCYGYLSGINASNSVQESELLYGGFIPATNATMRNSWFFQSTNFFQSSSEMGYSTHENHDGVFQNNDFIFGSDSSASHTVLESGVWTNHLDFRTNTFVSQRYLFKWFTNATAGYGLHSVNNNLYYSLQLAGTANWDINGQGFFTFANWKTRTGFDAASSLTTALPVANKIVVIPHRFLTNKVTVAIQNWAGSTTVASDISTGIASSTNINVYSAQDWLGSPVLSQSYVGGTIPVPKSSMVDNLFQVYFVEAAPGTNAVATAILTIDSSNPGSGVAITVSPLDNNGDSSGSTSFTRVYNVPSSVTLTAPATASGNNFQKWQLDGVDYSVSLSTVVTVNANHTMTAFYMTPVPPPTTTGRNATRRRGSPF